MEPGLADPAWGAGPTPPRPRRLENIIGEYRLAAQWPDAPRDNRYVNKDLATVATGAPDVRLVLEATGSIRGRVTLAGVPVTRYGIAVSTGGHGVSAFATGAPVEGATVAIAKWFRPREGELGLEEDPLRGALRDQRSTATGGDGRFAIRGIGKADWRPLRIIADHPMKGRSRERDLPADDAEIELTLQAVGGIAGVVTGVAADERVSVEASTGLLQSAGSVHTTGGARWQIDGLPAGKYTVTAKMIPDRSSRAIEVEVHAGQVTEIDIVFPRGEITLEVSTGDCLFVYLSDVAATGMSRITEPLASERCDETDHVTELRELVPGDYQVCVGETCKPVTIMASPKVQSLDARRWK